MQHSRYTNSPSTAEQRINIKTNNSSHKKNKKHHKREKLSVTTTELLQTHSDTSSIEFKDKKKGGVPMVKEQQKIVVIDDLSDEIDDDYEEESVTTRPSSNKSKTAMSSPGKRPAVIEVGDVVENVEEIKKKVKFDGKKGKTVVENIVEKTTNELTPFRPLENTDAGPTTIVAVDCEMVMTVGNVHALARCSIVNYNGHVLFDKMINPKGRITNYLTWVSGITPAKLRGAKSYDEYKDEIMSILRGRIIVGHSLNNDFEALNYFPQEKNTRDLAQFRRLKDSGKLLSLKKMVASHLNINFQDGAHDSVEDARAAMAIYRKFEKQWEEDIKQANYGQVRNMFLNDLKNALV